MVSLVLCIERKGRKDNRYRKSISTLLPPPLISHLSLLITHYSAHLILHQHHRHLNIMSTPEPEIQPAVAPPADVYVSTAKPKLPLTDEEWINTDKPKVLIVGTDTGGLFLRTSCIRQKFHLIFERAKVKNLAKATFSLGCIPYFTRKTNLTFLVD